LETQLAAFEKIVEVANEAGKPLTVDLQDGYGDHLEGAINKLVSLGVVGINLEDSQQVDEQVIDEQVAVSRIKTALKAAADAGVPDFVVNARADTWLRGGALDESIRRGKLYLEAGATSIYILGGGPDGVDTDAVKKMVDGLGGRVNIGLRLPKDGSGKALTSKQLAELGVSRISIGPQLYFATVEAMKRTAKTVFGNE